MEIKMRVKFKRPFFGPNAARYPQNTWIDIPDAWEERLPSDARIDERLLETEPAQGVLALEEKSDKKSSKKSKSLEVEL
jgi:hypothetical protein